MTARPPAAGPASRARPTADVRSTSRVGARSGARAGATRRPVPSRVARTTSQGGGPRNTQGRLKACLAVLGVLLLVVGARMVQLQGLDSAAYGKRAAAQLSHVTVLPAARGAITDRWGHVLADDLDLRLVFVDPTLEHHATTVAAQLAPILGKPQAALQAQLQTPGTRYVPLAHLVEPSVAATVLALKDPALGVLHESRRDHPGHDLAAALVGVTGSDTHGQSGIEALLDGTLSGSPGRQEQELDPAGTPIPRGVHTDTPAIDGSSVRLTIDRDLQYEAQQALQAQVTGSAARGGQIIVMNPTNGEVLALASTPGFDAQAPVTGSTNLHVPALETSYEPGSVNKVITAAAAIEDGVETPTSHIEVPSRYHYRGGVVRDAEDHQTEDLTFTGVLAKSSNIGTDLVAERVGNTRIYEQLRAFGLGAPSGLGYPGETAGVLPDVSSWNPAQAATIPFGQGMSATSLQIADAYAAIADGGLRVPARLIRSTIGPDGTVHAFPAAAPTRVVSRQTATTVTEMLEAVTSTQGTADKASIPGYRVAGKTGTAQAVGTNGRYEDGQFVDSFVGFAPADNPRLLVEVVIDHPEVGSHFGGETAAPVFTMVMGFALREFAVPPTGTKTPVLPLCWGTGSACPSQ